MISRLNQLLAYSLSTARVPYLDYHSNSNHVLSKKNFPAQIFIMKEPIPP